MSNLEKAVLQTVVYFDLFDYPLTSWEIWKYLFCEKIDYVDLNQILNILHNSSFLKKYIDYKSGYFFVKGRSEIINIRRQRYIYAKFKYKKALKLGKFIAILPWIKAIFVCNSLGISNAKKNSDIDLFIISSAGDIWKTRFFSTLIMSLLRARPTKNNQQDKICLSFFVDEDNLNMSNFTKDERDIYYWQWMASLTPIFCRDQILDKFWEHNKWLDKKLCNIFHKPICLQRKINIKKLSILKFLGGKSEILFKKIQYLLFPDIIKNKNNLSSTDVIIAEGVLKLHVLDRREFYRQEFEKRIKFLK